MAYGYSSDDDEFGGFLSDYSDEFEGNRVIPGNALPQDDIPNELTTEQKLNNLFYSIMSANLTDVINILEDEIDVNQVLRDGWTAIHLAASTGNPTIVRELINRGADVNANRDKYTVLMAACSCPETTSPFPDSLNVVLQLIEKGADVNAITRTRKTAIMFAASYGNVEVVRKLLSCPIDVNAVDNQGWNALFWAVDDNKAEVVQLLLDAGFRPDVVDVRGETPKFYAVSQGHEEIIKLFPVDVQETTNAILHESHYNLDELFLNLAPNQMPQFDQDIIGMLFGMKCEYLAEKFSNVSLLDFLCMDEEKLIEVGVTKPFQRYRILRGLYEFHKHIYKQKSIPVVAKDCVYSTMDVGNTIVSMIRQLIAMEGSLKYVSQRNGEGEHKNYLQPFQARLLRNKLGKMKKKAVILCALAEKWDEQNPPADLIHKNTKTPKPLWMQLLTYLSLLSVSTIMIIKFRNIK